MMKAMSNVKLKDYRPYKLAFSRMGSHRFGGPVTHRGACPRRAKVPLHRLLSLDLRDKSCPIETTNPIRYLPLYFPLKYGQGGPELQYTVISDSKIKIIHLSDPKPDADESQ